jgi:glycosyltransferase involved in cell wall biosynthesis
MKIMILHDPYKLIALGSLGGEDNLVQLEIDKLKERGHEVIDGRKIDNGYRRKFNQLRAQSFGSTSEVLEALEFYKPEIVHTHNLNQRSGYRWLNSVSVPVVSSLHNYRLFCPASIAWRNGAPCFECRDRTAFRAIANRCDSYVGLVNASRMLAFQRDFPQIKTPKKFILASNLMAKSLESLIPIDKVEILRSPGMKFSKPTTELGLRNAWLFAGRLTPEKGILNLIANWPSEEKLDIAGDGPLLEEIKRSINQKSNIKLIGKFAPNDNSVYEKYVGLIFASTWYEGSPLVVADSQATGTPVICTDESGAREFLEISNGGIVIKGSFTEDKLRQAMITIRDNFAFYSQNARISSQTKFSIEKWTLRLEEIFTDVLKQKNE